MVGAWRFQRDEKVLNVKHTLSVLVTVNHRWLIVDAGKDAIEVWTCTATRTGG